MVTRPESGEYAPFFATYINLVGDEDLLGALESQLGDTLSLLGSVSEEDSLARVIEILREG